MPQFLRDLSRSGLLMLAAGTVAVLIASYWFLEGITVPVEDVAQQTVQVLYNVHAAIWSLIAVLAFGFAGLFQRLDRNEQSATRPSADTDESPPTPPKSAERRERIEPRL